MCQDYSAAPVLMVPDSVLFSFVCVYLVCIYIHMCVRARQRSAALPTDVPESLASGRGHVSAAHCRTSGSEEHTWSHHTTSAPREATAVELVY